MSMKRKVKNPIQAMHTKLNQREEASYPSSDRFGAVGTTRQVTNVLYVWKKRVIFLSTMWPCLLHNVRTPDP